jgi:hypothetical protein
MTNEARRASAEAVLRTLEERGEQYGDSKELYSHLAKRWSALVGVEIDPATVVIMLMDMKISRFMKGSSGDTLHDLIGYSLLVQELENE